MQAPKRRHSINGILKKLFGSQGLSIPNQRDHLVISETYGSVDKQWPGSSASLPGSMPGSNSDFNLPGLNSEFNLPRLIRSWAAQLATRCTANTAGTLHADRESRSCANQCVVHSGASASIGNRDWPGRTEEIQVPSSAGHLPRVADRIISMSVMGLDGKIQTIKARWGEGRTLLDALKENRIDTGCTCAVHERGLEVCMGNCKVLVPYEWLDKIPPRTEEEVRVLMARLPGSVARSSVALPPNSRLSCIIPLSAELENMNVALTEPMPADPP